MPDAPRNDPNRYDTNRADPSRGIPDNEKRDAYDFTRSRTPEERRAERDERAAKTRQANLRGFDGIEKRGDVVQAGNELTQPNTKRAQDYVLVEVAGCLNGQFSIGTAPYAVAPAAYP